MKPCNWKMLVAGFLIPLFLIGAAQAAGDKKKAKEHFVKAESDYRLGRFKDALDEYSKAYEAAPLAGFLFNIGQCHRMLGNHERAIFFYRGYLREKPKARNRTMIEQLITSSQKEIEREKKRKEDLARLEAEQKKNEKLAKSEAERLRIEQERLKIEEQRRQDQLQLVALEKERLRKLAEAEKLRRESSPFYKTWWFWTIVGVAVAGAAAGTTIGLMSGEDHVLPGGSLGTLDLRGGL
jgi:tetratricopeptide (TPR) repeat protein